LIGPHKLSTIARALNILNKDVDKLVCGHTGVGMEHGMKASAILLPA
jgi:hypothetical protein